MIEQWYSDHCPKCQARNFVSNGDPADLTAVDVVGIVCWNCGHGWPVDENDDGSDEYDEPESMYERGIDLQELEHKRSER